MSYCECYECRPDLANQLDYDQPTELNLDLLDTVVTFAEQNEARHYQGTYMSNNGGDALCAAGVNSPQEAAAKFENVCGTTGCIAGWGAIFAGWCQTRSASYYRDWEEPNEGVVNPENGDTLTMHDAARYEFGLTRQQANSMFAGDNYITDIRDMVEKLRIDPNDSLFELSRMGRSLSDED